jgi:hypothetical protein
LTRLLPTLLVAALLAATTIAFGVTERLKLEESPITSANVEKTFSPTCRCENNTAEIRLGFRDTDRVTLVMEHDGRAVATLARRRDVRPGLVGFSWDGRDDSGRVVPDGAYRPRIELGRARHTISMPNLIRVDTKPPRLTPTRNIRRVISPDGDRRRDQLVVRYRVDEPANAVLYVDGVQRVRPRGKRLEGELRWYGAVNGKPVSRGRYAIAAEAFDPAGNSSGRHDLGDVRVRYVELPDRVVRVRGLQRIRVTVSTDVERLRWRLGPRRGIAGPSFVVRAPRRAGRYWLYVRARGHADRMRVVVSAARRRPPARPALTAAAERP